MHPPRPQAQGDSFDVALGKMLGTTAVVAAWPILLSFLPYRVLKRIFPPIVTGVTIFLIGVNLVATGFKVSSRHMAGACKPGRMLTAPARRW